MAVRPKFKKIRFQMIGNIPCCGQPLRGQSPGVRVQSAHNQKQEAKPSASDPSDHQIGTEARPAIVEMKDRPKSAAEAAEDRRKNDIKEFRERWTFYAAVAGVSISLLLFIVGRLGVWAAIRTLTAIEAQGKQADRHLVLVERPWLSPTIQLNGPLTVTSSGEIRIPILIEIENFGKSPATAITFKPGCLVDRAG
jgi:hypothetical protein